MSNGLWNLSGCTANGIAAYLEELAGPPGLSGQLITVATADVHAATFQVRVPSCCSQGDLLEI